MRVFLRDLATLPLRFCNLLYHKTSKDFKKIAPRQGDPALFYFFVEFYMFS